MKLTEIKQVLDDMGVNPSKKLGQNFLCDENIAKWIVDQLDPQTHDTVVEVGPGTGALTEHLIGRVKKIVLVEFDARLSEYLTVKFKQHEAIEVHHFDGARFDVRTLFKHAPIKLLGNLPYSAGGAIIRNFMTSPTPVTKAVLMLQKEFIDRIIATPFTKAYGVLSLRMQSQWESKTLKTISPEAFYPRPLIDSTVMSCIPVQAGAIPVYDKRLFDELIRRGFSQRRKQVKKQLPDTPAWTEVAASLHLKETSRAEEISLQQWIEITRLFDPHPLKDLPQCSNELFDVVSDQDKVLRQEKRSIVHSQGLLHRAVHILVFNKRKEVLLQKRSRLKDVFPGAWDSSAAGHLNVGEDYKDCAQRELREELGITTDIQEIAMLSPSASTGWEFVALFVARHDGSVRFPCSEVEDVMWVGVQEIDSWIVSRSQDFASGFLECWAAFKEKFQSYDPSF